MLYQWTKFQCHSFFPSQDLKQNVGMMEIQKFEYLENEKSSLDETKNIFHSF